MNTDTKKRPSSIISISKEINYWKNILFKRHDIIKWNEEERMIEDEFAKADSMIANYVLQSEKHPNATYKSQLINTRELIAK
ncbi:6756_t:CDS:1, partial [Cetraspora pellucida]